MISKAEIWVPSVDELRKKLKAYVAATHAARRLEALDSLSERLPWGLSRGLPTQDSSM